MILRHSLKLFTGAALAYSLVACSSGPKRVEYPASANPQAEIKRVEQKISEAKAKQRDVLAEDQYDKAVKYMKEAKEEAAEGSKNEEIFKELGKSEAAIDRAEEIAQSRQTRLADILSARQEALKAGAAATDEKRLNKVDDDLVDLADDVESNKQIPADDVASLQKRYLDLEVKAVKDQRLAETRDLIESAERMKAEKLSPKTLETARAKLKNAEAVIEVDRRNDSQISQAVAEALLEAQTLVSVTQTAAAATGQSPEEIALEIERRKVNAQALNAKLKTSQLNVEGQAAALGLAARQQETLKKTNSALADEKKFNDAFEKARQQISASEGEVYRQGDQLLIRLKGMRFSSGRSDLPAASLATLSKVKEIISEMNAKEVTVEGHTDSVGAADVNKKISEDRAGAVAKYFVAEQTLPENQIKSVGYGFEKPLTTNKTKEGRAQNRRVDVIISPETL